MSNEIAVKKSPFRVPVGLAARKAAAAAIEPAREAVTIEPDKMPDRIGIVFDDSGSMYGTIEDAHLAVEEFLRSCKPATTAVAIWPMNVSYLKMCTDLPQLAIQVKNIQATGGTSILGTLDKMRQCENLTRAIVFSDGEDSDYNFEGIISGYQTAKIPVDTVYIGPESERAIRLLKRIAEATGGIFLHFDPKKSNFRESFKYLAPGYRAMLADKSFADKIQGK